MMKKFSRIIISFLMLLTLACIIQVQGNAAPSKYFDATYYTQNIPNGYYKDVDTSKTDEDFRRMLSPIISVGYKEHSYKDNNEVLTYTDPDPRGNGNIICLYTGQSLSSGSWNKEHVWAKSHGFPGESTLPYRDAHHLRPTQNQINSTRGSMDFGEVPSGSSDKYGNRWGGGHFEPRDEVKGDVARMMFYMATRYGFDGTNNLTLVDASTTSGSTGNGRFGNLQTLLKWHYQDPVSKEEIYRNNIIYQFYQKNRNPYIDHPEYVDLAYPNSYSSSMEVDEAKVNNVIELIGSLPTTVTLDHKTQINAAKSAYDALNVLEKQRIVNYAELQRCVAALAALESGGTTNPDPVTPEVPTEAEKKIDFTSVTGVGGAYTNNANVTASGESFFASAAGTWDNAFRIGSKTPISLSSFGLSDKGHYLEPKFEVENLLSMKVTVSKTFSGTTHWYVFFKDSSGNYKKVNEGDITSTSGFEMTAKLSAPAKGKFIVVVMGTQPRMDITSMSLYTGSGSSTPTPSESLVPSFISEQTKASIRLDYDKSSGTMNEVDLRFGAKISASSFNSNAKYGVIVYEAEYADSFVAGEQLGQTSASDFAGQEYCLEITPVRVNENGEEDANGDYYQFAWVITNMEGHYSDSLVAVIYMEYEGKLYFAKATTSSLSSVAQKYIDSNEIVDSVVIQILESLTQ